MTRKNDKKRTVKKHAKALKRRKKLATRVEPRRAGGSHAVPPDAWASAGPREFSVWDPGGRGAWGRSSQGPTLIPLPGPGPDLVAVAFGKGEIAVYPRAEDGSTRPVALSELPVDREVGWVGKPAPVRGASVEDVAWWREPRLEAEVLRGALIVHALVTGEEGTTWSPVVPVEVLGEGDTRELRAGGVAEGVLRRDGIQWQRGADDTHVEAVASYLTDQVPLLWRVLDGGAGIDAAWRVRAIRGPFGGYKRWAMEELIAHAGETVPHLLGILDEVLEGGPAARDLDDAGALYALTALAHLGVPEAHPRFLALARLDDFAFEELFGGYITEQFDAALLRTASGDVGGIRELVRDRTADDYLRSQAAYALVGAVALGWAERMEILSLFASQLDPDDSEDPDTFLQGSFGGGILDLHGVEYEEQLVAACEAGLIDPMDFHADYVRERLHGAPAALDPTCLQLVRTQDVHDWISWWAAFHEPRW